MLFLRGWGDLSVHVGVALNCFQSKWVPTSDQDKVDGIGAESNINNNWENRQKWTLKIGGSMG